MIVKNERSGVRHLADSKTMRTICGLDAQGLNVVDLSSLEKEKEYQYCTCRVCLQVRKMRRRASIYHQWNDFYQDIMELEKKHVPRLEYALESTIFIRAGEMIYKYIWETKHHLEKLSKKREKFHPLIQENYAQLDLLFGNNREERRIIVAKEGGGSHLRKLFKDITFCGLDSRGMKIVDSSCTCRDCLRVQKMKRRSIVFNGWNQLSQDILELRKLHVPRLEYCLSPSNFLLEGDKIHKFIWEAKYRLTKIHQKGEKFHPLIEENYARLHLLFEEEKGGKEDDCGK